MALSSVIQQATSSRTASGRPVLHNKGVFIISRLHAHDGSADTAVAVAPPPSGPSSQWPAPNSQLPVVPPPVASVTEQSAVKEPKEVQPPVAPAPSSRDVPKAAPGRRLLFATPSALSYLDGTLPGDYGWDPLGLARPTDTPDPTMNLRWLSYAELIHGRWAMLAVAGALAPEVLARAGIIPAETGLPWFEAGGLYAPGGGPAIPFFGTVPFDYWTDQYTLFWTMMVAMGFAETRRLQDYRNPGSMKQQYFLGLQQVLGGSGSPPYPAGPFFNLANLGKTEAEMFRLKTQEVKHGRLAMVAWLAFMVQAQTTHRGPVANIFDHMAAPHTENLLSRVGGFSMQASTAEKVPFMLWLLAGLVMTALLNPTAGSNTRTKA